MTKDENEAIRKRVERATKGPWSNGYELVMRWSEERERNETVAECVHDRAMEDSEFIAAARQDVPALLAEVDRLKAIAESALDLCKTREAALEAVVKVASEKAERVADWHTCDYEKGVWDIANVVLEAAGELPIPCGCEYCRRAARRRLAE